jgi:hypothetical protein
LRHGTSGNGTKIRFVCFTNFESMRLFPLNMIRYLIVCRVNRSVARLPEYPSPDASFVLSRVIADRLPTVQARPWRKKNTLWDEYDYQKEITKKKPAKVPDISWPIESAICFYPGKKSFGRNELVLWELKLIGESADHGLFLGVILPALEDAGRIRVLSSKKFPNSFWGAYDIHAIYYAMGSKWKPIVDEGRLNLNVIPKPEQWARGISFKPQPDNILDRLTWLTPVDPEENPPTVKSIMEALLNRLSILMGGKYTTPEEFLNELSKKDRNAFLKALDMASDVVIQKNDLSKVPSTAPGRIIGTQTFRARIPSALHPYLGFASLFHIGKYTHFGCGTFLIN